MLLQRWKAWEERSYGSLNFLIMTQIQLFATSYFTEEQEIALVKWQHLWLNHVLHENAALASLILIFDYLLNTMLKGSRLKFLVIF